MTTTVPVQALEVLSTDLQNTRDALSTASDAADLEAEMCRQLYETHVDTLRLLELAAARREGLTEVSSDSTFNVASRMNERNFYFNPGCFHAWHRL